MIFILALQSVDNIEIGLAVAVSVLGGILVAIVVCVVIICCWWCNARKNVRDPLQNFGEGAMQVLGAAYSCQCCTSHSKGVPVEGNTVRGSNIQGARVEGDSGAIRLPEKSNHGFNSASAQKFVDVIKKSIKFGREDDMIVHLLDDNGITLSEENTGQGRELCAPATECEGENSTLPEIKLHNGGDRVN